MHIIFINLWDFDVIVTDETVEIDGFGVLEDYRHKGIGTTMQSYVGHLAGSRPVILVADGDDTAKTCI